MAHQLPPLPYAFDALEPHIDAQTMEIHHGKHHQAYVTNLNAALEKYPELQSKSIEDLLRRHQQGARRHPHGRPQQRRRPHEPLAFWKWMAPKAGGAPTGALGDAIKSTFGSFDGFKEQFTKAGVTRFGSGWAWLIDTNGKLSIESTANQDQPIMEGKKADARRRRLGARLLPEVSEPPARLPRRVVEHGELVRGRFAARQVNTQGLGIWD